MDAKAEARALADAERHAAEFRRKHRIPDAEWQRAEEMTADLAERLLAEFWSIRDRDDRRSGSRTLPGSGLEAEMRASDGPSEEGKSAPLRKPRPRRSQRSR